MISSSARIKILSGKKNIDPHQFFHLSDNSHGLRGHSLNSQAILQQIPSWSQEKLFQSKGHQFLEQSSSACRRRHLS